MVMMAFDVEMRSTTNTKLQVQSFVAFTNIRLDEELLPFIADIKTYSVMHSSINQNSAGAV